MTKITRMLSFLILSTCLFAAESLAASEGSGHLFKVNCSKGETIAKALKNAEPGDTIQITGTCHEKVNLITDRLTLDGIGSAIVDGGGGDPTEFDGVITIWAADGVTIKDLTVQNGSGEGIRSEHGSAVSLENITVQSNAGTGVGVSGGSTARIHNLTSQDNALGMDIITASSAILTGAINLNHNDGNGININGEAIIELRGADLSATNNGSAGIVAGSNAQIAIFGFATSQGSSITANSNELGGLIIASGGLLQVFGQQFAGNGANVITALDNGTFGIFLPGEGGISAPFGNAKFVIKGNVFGMSVGDGSNVAIDGGLDVSGNLFGISAEGAALTLSSSFQNNPSSINDNGNVDVNLAFGTRASIFEVTVGSVACDDTVLLRGTTGVTCPHP